MPNHLHQGVLVHLRRDASTNQLIALTALLALFRPRERLRFRLCLQLLFPRSICAVPRPAVTPRTFLYPRRNRITPIVL